MNAPFWLNLNIAMVIIMRYCVLARSELSDPKFGGYEVPVFFDDFSEAQTYVERLYVFYDGYPCNGDAYIFELVP